MAAVFVVMLLTAALGGYGFSIWRQVDAAGGLTMFIQNKLSQRAEGVFGSIEKAELEFSVSTLPVRLKASNIRLNASDTIIVLPQSEFRFSFVNLLLGNLTPTEMSLSGLEIEIEQGSKGWHAGPSMALLTSLVDDDNAISGGPLTAIRSLFVDDAKLRIMRNPDPADVARIDWIEIEPIAITLSKKNNVFQGKINASDAVGGAFEIDFTGNAAGTDLNFSATLSEINATEIYPYLGIDVPEISSLGLVTGRLAMSVRDRRLQQISGDLVSTDGKTALPGYGDIDFASANIIFAHDVVLDTLTISNLDLATRNFSDRPDGRLTIAGQVRNLMQPRPTLIANIKGSNFSFGRVIELWPESAESALRQTVKESLDGGRVSSFGIDTVGVINRAEKVFEVSTLDLISDVRQVRLETGFGPIDRLVGSLSARFEMSIDKDGSIDHGVANFLLTDALLLPKGSSRKIDLEGVEVRTRLDGNTIQVTRAAVDARALGQLAMFAEVDITSDWHPHRFDMEVRAEQVDTQLVTELWPRSLWARTRQWVENRIDGGTINGLKLKGGFDLPESEPMKVIYLEGEAQIADTELTYLTTMPPLENTWARVNFQGTSFRADIDSGTVEGLDLAGSRFIMRPTAAGPEADLALIATGDFGGAMRLLDHPRLDVLNAAGLQPTNAEGQIDLTMGLKWIIPKSGETVSTRGGVAINATASVEDMALDNLPYQTDIRGGMMDIVYLNRKLSISGRGSFSGVPGFVSLDRYPDQQVEMDLALSRSDALTDLINTRAGLDLGGQAGGAVKIRREAASPDLQLDVNLDLDETSLNIRRLGVVKLPGERARLDAMLRISDGQIETIGDINLDSDVLRARGQISFDETGRFLGAFFDEMAWPGNDISFVTIERSGDDVLTISASAELIDLTPLRREESPGEGFAMTVDLTADRIILDQMVTLSGNVSFTTDKDGQGKADFLGGLFLKNKEFMTEAAFTALFGGGNDLLEGRGLVGGAEASITLSPADDGGNLMVLRSNNAGQVLKSLKVLDAIRGGKLNMVVHFRSDDTGVFDADFELEDFRVIEAPRAVRMMSVLSLAGLYSLIEGDGTFFDLGHARIEVMPGRQIIHQARASGEALAVDLVGVIDTERQELEVSGMLLPVYGITKLIGKVPLISEIVTGLENEGIFVTQFSITGPVSEPENNVNLSSIVPGLFRDVFSPDWIRRERERLIGDNVTADNTSAAQ
ncbi:MAG: DUF3971 domain-containing protein [Candidatus Puniceispirillales bacterium]